MEEYQIDIGEEMEGLKSEKDLELSMYEHGLKNSTFSCFSIKI